MFTVIKIFLYQFGVPLAFAVDYLILLPFLSVFFGNQSDEKSDLMIEDFLVRFSLSLPLVFYFFKDHGLKGIIFLLIVTGINIVLSIIKCLFTERLRFGYYIMVLVYIFVGTYYLYWNYLPTFRDIIAGCLM